MTEPCSASDPVVEAFVSGFSSETIRSLSADQDCSGDYTFRFEYLPKDPFWSRFPSDDADPDADATVVTL
jgi:hypothetical protein